MSGNAEALREYWTSGAGGDEIGWGDPGDFDRCTSAVGKYVDDPEAYCAERHHDATGEWPATHAAEERGSDKNISLGAPLATSIAPYDLVGQAKPPACDLCGAACVPGRDGEGWDCPNGHGMVAFKYSDDEARDAHGRWVASGGGEDRRVEYDDVRTKTDPTQYDEKQAATVHLKTTGEMIGRVYQYRSVNYGSGRSRGSGVVYSTVWRAQDEKGRTISEAANKHDAVETVTRAWNVRVRGDSMYPPYARKFDPSQPRDDAGKWTQVGSLVSTDEGILGGIESRGGDGTIRDMERGLSPNVRPEAVKGIMEAALAHKFDKPVDLDHLRVEGTRQFGQDGLRIPRDQMPQIPFEKRDEFFGWLRDRGIGVELTQVNPQSLQPTQSEISVERTAGVWAQIKAGDPQTTDGIMSSKDDYVLDGHHRWAGYTALSFEQPGVMMNTYRIDAPIRDLLKLSNQWNDEAGVSHRALVAGGSGLLAKIDAELARRGVRLN